MANKLHNIKKGGGMELQLIPHSLRSEQKLNVIHEILHYKC